MEIIFYSSAPIEAGERLQKVIEMVISKERLELFRTLKNLELRLRQPAFNPRIAILLASSREELENILSIRGLLEDAKKILIVPDTNPATLTLGHALRPRFLSDCNSDFLDIAAVLSQMIRKLKHN